MDYGRIGATVGTLTGIIGGVLGTWNSLSHAKSAAERRFIVRCAIGLTSVVGLFLAGMFLIPSPYRFLLWVPYAIALPLAIRSCQQGPAKLSSDETT